jgi:membrane-bound lytic murein transglycosylase MltF
MSALRSKAAGSVGGAMVALLLAASLLACGASGEADPQSREAAQPEQSELKSSFDAFPALKEPWTGDLDGMVERGFIRALVTYSKTNYFFDGANQRGITYEALREFEELLNQRLGRRMLKVDIIIIPVRRDELFPALVSGLGDIAAANLTITPERLEQVDFSDPFAQEISEVIVTGPGGPTLGSLDELAGQEIHVRPSSSYWASLEALSSQLESRGLDPVKVVPAEGFLEDEDLLEMVNIGVLPMIVVDSHKVAFWAQVFDDIVVHDELRVRSGGEIAWALRKGCPQLTAEVNAFVKGHKKGTLFGNVLLKRYFQENTWAKNPFVEEHRKRFDAMADLFRRFGDEYDFDYLLLAALAYQESQLDQSKRSHAGAVGVMQMLPTTAADPNVGIPDITVLENNIHAGAKYLRFLRDRYFSDPEIGRVDQALFSFAAYNAGPARINRLRNQARDAGLDPNRWFNNVEIVVARKVGREPIQYVSNITKYYVAYRMIAEQLLQRLEATGTPP